MVRHFLIYSAVLFALLFWQPGITMADVASDFFWSPTTTPLMGTRGIGKGVTSVDEEELKQAIKSIKDIIANLQAQIADMSASKGQKIQDRKSEELEEKALPPGLVLKLERALQGGDSGEDVKSLQNFLKQFPDVYPEGLETGYFGKLTEKAIQRLQKALNIVSSGNPNTTGYGRVGPKTAEKIEKLTVQIERKRSPKIFSVFPDPAALGSTIELTGKGFTFDGNAIMIRGQKIADGLSSDDGGTKISFILPANTPCLSGSACPIKVFNENGISNARPFKTSEVFIPEEPPLPPPEVSAPTSTEPLLAPSIKTISPSYGVYGTEVAITGTGFTSNGNSINFGGTEGVISEVSSLDEKTLKFNIPNGTQCFPVSECAVSVTNTNGVSNEVVFTLTQEIIQVALLHPNGGEYFIKGEPQKILWNGGTDRVKLALVEPLSSEASDPTGFIVGWLKHSVLTDSSISWDGREICDYDLTVCSLVQNGEYKILIVSENEFGDLVVWDDVRGKPGNIDISDRLFTILPEANISVISPNGGERFVLGDTMDISWSAESIVSKTIKIELLKNGAFYHTIASNFEIGADTGIFAMSWLIPQTILSGSDYSIRISDTANFVIYDTSDALFSFAQKASLAVLSPNGGEVWSNGFEATVRWSAANLPSKEVSISILKGGIVERTIAARVPQRYSWSSTNYSSGTFDYKFVVPVDLEAGDDYSILVADADVSAISDMSDANFKILAMSGDITLRGRLIDRFSNEVLSDVRLYNHAYYGSSLPQWSSSAGVSDGDGKFLVSTTTSDGFVLKIPVGAWSVSMDKCYMNWQEFIYNRTDGLWLRSHIFDGQTDAIYMPESSDVNLGDVPMWRAARLRLVSDRPDWFGPQVNYYPDNVSYGGSQILAVGMDVEVFLSEPITYNRFYAPSIRLDEDSMCDSVVLTYVDGVFAWQPYIITTSYISGSYSLGEPVNITYRAYGGVEPYEWSVLYGSLPPGLSLDGETGTLSGTASDSGYYAFGLKVIDANGVIGGSGSRGGITILSP